VSPEDAAGLIVAEPGTDVAGQAAGGVASIGHGVLKAGTGLASFPAFIQDLIRSLPPSKAFGPSPISPIPFPHEADIEDYMAKRSKETFGDYAGVYQPQNIGEKYISRAAQGAASMPGGRAAVPILGGISGMVGEAAHQWNPEQPLARTLGEIVTLLAAAPVALGKPQAVKAVQDYVKELGPYGFRAAQAAREAAESRTGVKGILTQGVPTSSALSGITEEIRRTPMGAEINRILAAQTPAMQDQVSRQVAQLSGLPLEQETANRVLDAGRQATYVKPQGIVSRAEKPFYDIAAQERLPTPTLDQIVKSLEEKGIAAGEAVAPSERGPFRKAASDIAQIIEETAGKPPTPPTPPTPPQPIVSKILGPDGKPIVSRMTPGQPGLPGTPGSPPLPNVLPVDQVAVNARTATVGATTAAERAAVRPSEMVYDMVSKLLKGSSFALASAKAVGKTGRSWITEPMKEGPMGRTFPQRLVDQGSADFHQLANSLEGMSAADVKYVAEQLHAVDSEAFPALVKRYMTDRVTSKFEPVAGRVSPTALNDVPNEFIGTPEKREAFTEMMRAVARAQGKNPDDVAQSAVHLMEDMQLFARDQTPAGSWVPTSAKASTNWLTRALKGFGLSWQPLHGVGHAISYKMYKDTYEKIANALVSPNGVQVLEDLATHSMAKQRTQNIARALMSVGVQQAGNEYQLPRGNEYQ
jgi:hypothetical protein